MNVPKRIVTLCLVCAVWSSNALTKNHLEYSLSGSGNYYPYYTHDPRAPGILPEAIQAILKEANITGEDLLLPAKRTNYYLQQQKIDFDLVSPSWLKDTELNNPQYIFSIAILPISEYIVTRLKTHVPPSLEHMIVGTVRGYYYHNDEVFERVDFNSEKELMLALHRKRVDQIIIGNLPALYWSKKLNIRFFMAAIHSQGYIHMRLLSKHKHLLPTINKAIEALSKKTYFKNIERKYLQSLSATSEGP
ncbi:ABC transporter substrate-binding protein [Pseudoalteromonas sp. MMG012]|uniref:substrate-binding periplasmic protein n=1 Tax=Pseudoalteromonas sp. MMG012 TaxID=2822686 RepID=UPI001B3A07FE|nr:transporter substrate-binding domain-containing protein [Pseudoalteromonas sp. MMG012]MBQ4849409.1 transporter substrate-binding domain-containing protein [Pseudoalteromonas sp. MMG012]